MLWRDHHTLEGGGGAYSWQARIHLLIHQSPWESFVDKIHGLHRPPPFAEVSIEDQFIILPSHGGGDRAEHRHVLFERDVQVEFNGIHEEVTEIICDFSIHILA